MQAPDYGLILNYGVQMTITFLICLGLWTVKVNMLRTKTAEWYQANLLSISISFGLFWVISAGLVIVPNIAMLSEHIGFNADQSAAGIALVIVGFLIGGSFDPGKRDPPDPIP
jgi:succinate-acetate transporter protein